MTSLQKVESIGTVDIFDNVERTKDLAKKLMMTKHYQKIGEDGIFAICMVAQANEINQLDALNGELYYVQGRVGMSAEAMNKYIRKQGHSITLKSLTDQGCTIVGKRKDTGDMAEITYNIDDMRSAGKDYQKNKKDMFFARAISRLKRILFPDILTKVYEKSEMDELAYSEKQDQSSQFNAKPLYIVDDKPLEKLTTEQVIDLQTILNECSPEYQEQVKSFLPKKYKVSLLDDVPMTEYEYLRTALTLKRDAHQKALVEAELANIKTEEE